MHEAEDSPGPGHYHREAAAAASAPSFSIGLPQPEQRAPDSPGPGEYHRWLVSVEWVHTFAQAEGARFPWAQREYHRLLVSVERAHTSVPPSTPPLCIQNIKVYPFLPKICQPPDPTLSTPLRPTESSAPAFTLGMRNAPPRPSTADVPGPGTYLLTTDGGGGGYAGSPSAPSYTMRPRTSGLGPEGPGADVPGPGTYERPGTIGAAGGPAFTMAARPQAEGG